MILSKAPLPNAQWQNITTLRQNSHEGGDICYLLFMERGVSLHSLFLYELQHAAGPVVLLVVVDDVGVWELYAILHEVSAAVGLAFDRERLVVDAVELMDGVVLGWIETGHLNAWEVLVLEGLELPPEEDSLGLVGRDVHL